MGKQHYEVSQNMGKSLPRVILSAAKDLRPPNRIACPDCRSFAALRMTYLDRLPFFVKLHNTVPHAVPHHSIRRSYRCRRQLSAWAMRPVRGESSRTWRESVEDIQG